MTMNTPPISIKITPLFLPQHSDPDEHHYTFSYTIEITNHSEATVKLISRHWIVTDGNAECQEVHGEGVIGQQPRLNPNESYEYSSNVILTTPVGWMHGSYTMRKDNGEEFDAPIPRFRLEVPEILN
jgi:ApaG protein